MYARETEDGQGNKQVRSLMASGKLWRDALVMMDRESRSLWTQHDGRALLGPASEQGLRLRALPSEKMSWAEARLRYPGAKVLKKRMSFLGRGKEDIYAGYGAQKDAASVFGSDGGGELPAKAEVFGFRHRGQAAAVPISVLPTEGALEVELGGERFFVNRRGVLDVAGRPLDARRIYWFAWRRANPGTVVLLGGGAEAGLGVEE